MASGTSSARVRIPEGDLIFFDPPLLLTLYILLGGKIITERQRKGAVGVREAGGVKIMRRRNNYPVRARLDQKFEKKTSHSAENCRTLPKIPYSIS